MDAPPPLRPLVHVATLLWFVGWGVLAVGTVGVTLYELYPWTREWLP